MSSNKSYYRRGRLQHADGPKTAISAWLLIGMFFLFCSWLVFSFTGLGHRTEAVILGALPDALVVVNLILAPCSMALAAGELRIRVSARFVLGALMLLSIVMLEISFRRFLFASCAVTVLLVLEAYWIIPRWNAKRHTAS